MSDTRNWRHACTMVLAGVAACAAAVPLRALAGSLAAAAASGEDADNQRATMSILRSIGTAVESYQVDYGFVPRVASGAAATQLGPFLQPTFVKEVRERDAWQHTILWV